MKILNIGIMAHVDAGKTTVTEGFLYHSGIKASMGNVDDGTTTTDSMELEKKRGMTIRSATVSFMIGTTKVNLIDTPGHMDFIAEVERSLSVLDGVVLVISAKEGVQPQTRSIFHKLYEMRIPTIIYINKIDRIGVNLEKVYLQIKEELTSSYIAMQKVYFQDSISDRSFSLEEIDLFSSTLKEQLIGLSDELLEKYMNDKEINHDEYEHAMINCINNACLYPIYHGSALKDCGITELMKAVDKWFLPRACHEEELSAYVYKVVAEKHDRKLFYIRIFSGCMFLRMRCSVYENSQKMIVRNLFGLENGRLVPKKGIISGDAAVIINADGLKCGDWIGNKTILHEFSKTEPLLNIGIRPTLSTNRRELLEALNLLTMEDPCLALNINEETEEITLRLFGDLQKEILKSLLKERFNLEVEFDSIYTIKKDKPICKVSCIIPLNSTGNLLRAGVGLTLEPLTEGGGFQYETQVSLGDLSKSFQNGVREGVEKAIKKGLHGEVVDTKVTFDYFDYDSVTSTPSDFRSLAEKVVYKALQKIGTLTLEPVMKYTLTAPLEHERKIIKELTSMKATIVDTIHTQTEIQISGKVTLDTCRNFPSYLLTITEGKGIFETCFYQYEKTEGAVSLVI